MQSDAVAKRTKFDAIARRPLLSQGSPLFASHVMFPKNGDVGAICHMIATKFPTIADSLLYYVPTAA